MQRQWFGKQNIMTKAYVNYMLGFICPDSANLTLADTLDHFALGLGEYEPITGRLWCNRP